jgi:hypothetical protein
LATFDDYECAFESQIAYEAIIVKRMIRAINHAHEVLLCQDGIGMVESEGLFSNLHNICVASQTLLYQHDVEMRQQFCLFLMVYEDFPVSAATFEASEPTPKNNLNVAFAHHAPVTIYLQAKDGPTCVKNATLFIKGQAMVRYIWI